MFITSTILDELTAKAKATPRLRANYNLRNSAEDGSQRMLNAIEPGTGVVVEQGDMKGMADVIRIACDKGKDYFTEACRKRTEEQFDKDKCFEKYVVLYEGVVSQR